MSSQIEASSNAEEPAVLQKVWPTLFIAVGGTGTEIALRVRRRIVNYIWGFPGAPVRIDSLAKFPLAQFINFDLNKNHVTQLGRSASTDMLDKMVKFTDEEKLIIEFDLGMYTKTEEDIDRFPLVAPWFPMTRKKANELRIDTSKGAGQIRSLSRLYFFDKYPAIKDMIENKIGALLAGVTSRKQTQKLGLELEQASLRVVVIASTAGGTGSGAFLDMGYLAKWLAKREGAKVDLALMLPTGYSGNGRERTRANTYAALMELEACTGHGIEYTKGWQMHEELELPDRPYDDIFLFDTGNLANQRLNTDIQHIYDMVADILFEDFTSAEFANQKRSVAVNQEQYKSHSFTLPLAPKYGEMNIMYSKSYSAFGQSIIDTQLEQTRDKIACKYVITMLKVFFGISIISEENKNSPEPDEARKVLREHAFCNGVTFQQNYDFAIGSSDAFPYQKNAECNTLKLVSKLLNDDYKSMIDREQGLIKKKINTILTSPTEKDQRIDHVDEFLKTLNRDLGLGSSVRDAGAGAHESEIIKNRKSLYSDMTTEKSGLLKTLWAAVDNKQDGGISYTIKLVEKIKDEIDNDTTGLVSKLDSAQDWFSELREKLRNNELQCFRERLKQTRGGRWYTTNRNNAETVLEQIGEVICNYTEARLREVACREAKILLGELSSWLGKHVKTTSARKQWTKESYAGKLSYFEGLVKDIMKEMDNEEKRITEAMSQTHPAYQIITVPMQKMDDAERLDFNKAMEWAKKVFNNSGGSQVIFEELKEKESRSELIGDLRQQALKMLPSINNNEQDPLTEVFLKMDVSERINLFSNCLLMAMPWVDADLQGIWTVNPDQYQCIIGTNKSNEFEKEFREEFNRTIPSRTGINPQKIAFYDTGSIGKLTCYVEISGIPLLALNKLGIWRTSYNNREVNKIPLHTHKDHSIFVHPMALNMPTLDRLANEFKLYIQGIVMGLLKFRTDELNERSYCIIVSGEKLSIGKEQNIRKDGIPNEFLDNCKKDVVKASDRVKTSAQYVGLATLFEFYCSHVYKPIRKRMDDNSERLVKGFACILCEKLKNEAEKTAREKMVAAGSDYDKLHTLLNDDLSTWTDEIVGSENDVYENEVNADHKPKRVLKPEFFEQGWLERRFRLDTQNAAIKWHINLNGTANGPHDENGLKKLVEEGQLTLDTKMWKKGMPKWKVANQIEELDSLFSQPPPLDEDEPPPLDEDEPPPLDDDEPPPID